MDLSWIDELARMQPPKPVRLECYFDQSCSTKDLRLRTAFVVCKNRICSFLEESDIQILAQVNKHFRSEFGQVNNFVKDLLSNVNRQYDEGIEASLKNFGIEPTKKSEPAPEKSTKPLVPQTEPTALRKSGIRIKNVTMTPKRPDPLTYQNSKKENSFPQHQTFAKPKPKFVARPNLLPDTETSGVFAAPIQNGNRFENLTKKDLFNQTDQGFHAILNKGTQLLPPMKKSLDLTGSKVSMGTVYLNKKPAPEIVQTSNPSFLKNSALANSKTRTSQGSLKNLQSKSNLPEFFTIPWKTLMEINTMIERKKIEPEDREKISNHLFLLTTIQLISQPSGRASYQTSTTSHYGGRSTRQNLISTKSSRSGPPTYSGRSEGSLALSENRPTCTLPHP